LTTPVLIRLAEGMEEQSLPDTSGGVVLH